jgi:hypothetical protein
VQDDFIAAAIRTAAPAGLKRGFWTDVAQQMRTGRTNDSVRQRGSTLMYQLASENMEKRQGVLHDKPKADNESLMQTTSNVSVHEDPKAEERGIKGNKVEAEDEYTIKKYNIWDKTMVQYPVLSYMHSSCSVF